MYIGKEQILTLTKEMHFIELCLHGSGHLWSRFHWLMDIAKILNDNDIDWPRVVRIATERDVEDIILGSSALVEEFFDVGLPTGLQFEVRANSKKIESLVNRSLIEISREEDLPQGVVGKTRRLLFLRTLPNSPEWSVIFRKLLYNKNDWLNL